MSPFIDVRRIKELAQFEPVLVRYGIVLKGSRVQRLVTCPFHTDAHPSCSIHLRRKLFHCFGCGARGSILDFVAKMEGVSIPEAALIIADCCGIRFDNNLLSTSRRNTDEIAHGDRGAIDPEGANARNRPLRFTLTLEAEHPYLRARGVSQSETHVFGLGYCRYGLMQSRICIPIHDERGVLVAYAGRWAAEERPVDVKRYLLPRGFRKGSVVYNLHRVAGAEHVAIVEGYWSVFRLYRLGVPAVALMGTSLSATQEAHILRSGVRFITLLLDGDEAGRRATAEIAPRLVRNFFVRAPPLLDGTAPDDVAEEVLRSALNLPFRTNCPPA